MNLNELAKMLCSAEGKKKQVSIAQMKEIIKVIIDLDPETYSQMLLLFSKARTRKQVKEMKETI